MPIRVRLLGHLASQVGRSELVLEGATVAELLEGLFRLLGLRMAKGGVLVAVNGVAVSALDGESTQLKDGDLVELIPVIHGGR